MTQQAGYLQYYNATERAGKVLGVDIAQYAFPVSWTTMKNKGVKFCIQKAGGNVFASVTCRYIRVSVNGSYTDTNCYFTEIQAYDTSFNNVSSGKIVTSSAPPTSGTLAALTNGDTNSQNGYTLIENPSGTGQWVQIDLGASVAVRYIQLWFLNRVASVKMKGVKVETSQNGTDWTTQINLTAGNGYEYTERTDGAMFIFGPTNAVAADLYKIDPQFTAANVAAARAAGIKMGFFWFYNPNYMNFWNKFPQTSQQEAVDQATAFYNMLTSVLGSNKVGDVYPMLDFENAYGSVYPAFPSDDSAYNWIETFVKTFKQLSGVDCGIYTAYYTLDTLETSGTGQLVHSTKGPLSNIVPILWHATNVAKAPYDVYTSASFYNYTVYGGYSKWTIWQFSSDANGQGAAYGTAGADIDLNVLEGPLDSILITAEPTEPAWPEEIVLHRSFTLNGQTSDAWGIVMKSELDTVPPFQLNQVTIPYRAGAYVPVKNYGQTGVRTIQITLFMNQATRDAHNTAKHDIAAFLLNLNRDAKAKRLVFSDDPNRVYDVWFEGETNYESINVTCGLFTFSLTATMPFSYDPATKYAYWSAGSTTVSFTNNGTVETFPTVYVTVNGTVYWLSVVYSGKMVGVSATLSAGQTLVADNSRNIVYVNESGASLMTGLDIASRFFSVPPKTSATLTLNSTAFSSAYVAWTERYV